MGWSCVNLFFHRRRSHAPGQYVIFSLKSLSLNGQAEGATSEFLNFIAKSPVAEMINHFTDSMEAQGAGAIVNNLCVRPGQSVAVFGAGGIGLCAIAAAAAVDAHPIIAVDVAEEKLAFAQRFGATNVINAKKSEPVAAIRELTDGGVDYAIDAIGLPQTQEQILRTARMGYPGLSRGGTALLIGITPPGAQAILDTSLFIGSRSFTRTSGGDSRPDRDFPLFVRWFREGKLKLDELVTRRYALEQINEAVDDLEHGRILGRAIITYA